MPQARMTSPETDSSAVLRRVAIVGAASLKGKELKEVLEARNFPTADVRLLDDDESLGQLDAVGEEATFIQAVRPENFDDVALAFFASDAAFTVRHWTLAREAGAAVVDLSYALEDEPGAVVRAPWVESELSGAPAAGNAAGPIVVAHPVAVVLALVLARVRRAAAVRSAVATVFEPASEQGRRGMDELHQQTVNLLSFQDLPRQVFDSQVAFNLLSRYGDEAPVSLESVERRILKHFAQITGAGKVSAAASAFPVPSLMLVQTPTFHGYVFSIYIELGSALPLGDFAQALAGDHVTVTPAAEDAPNNVTAAGQEEIQLAVRRDPLREQAFWVWATADNLKMAAMCAADCAQSVAPPKRRLQ